jgi:hypothetical protein
VENPPASPNIGRATLFGLLAGAVVALVYGVLAEIFDLSLGLVVVGLVGGFVIGAAVVSGAFGGRFHLVVPRIRWLAALLGVVSWLVAVLIGYVMSQLLFEGAATPLVDRLSVSGFLEYLNGSLFSPSILGLAGMAFMAWRGAK